MMMIKRITRMGHLSSRGGGPFRVATAVAVSGGYTVFPGHNRGYHGLTVSSIETHPSNNPSKVRRTFSDADGQAISPWHDVPFRVASETLDRKDAYNKGNGALLHVVCTNPRHHQAVMDVAYFEPYNPLYHTSNSAGQKRYHLVPPTFNMGVIPQTYAHPLHVDALLGQDLKGNNSALHAIDLSAKTASPGEVYALQILGAVAVTDPQTHRVQWVLLGGRPNDDTVKECKPDEDRNTIPDINSGSKLLTKRINDIQHWLVTQKMAEGGPELPLASRGKIFSSHEAMEVARTHNDTWCQYVLRDRVKEYEQPLYGYQNLSVALEKPWRPPIDWEPYQSPYLPDEYRYELSKPRDPLDYYSVRSSLLSEGDEQKKKELIEGANSKLSDEGPQTRRAFAKLPEDFGEKTLQDDPAQVSSKEEADLVVLQSLIKESPLHIHRMAVIRLASVLPETGRLPSSERIVEQYQEAMSLAGGMGGFVEEADSSDIRADMSEPGMNVHGHDGLGPDTPRVSLEIDGPLARSQIHEAMIMEMRHSGQSSPRVQAVRELLLKASPQPSWFDDSLNSTRSLSLEHSRKS